MVVPAPFAKVPWPLSSVPNLEPPTKNFWSLGAVPPIPPLIESITTLVVLVIVPPFPGENSIYVLNNALSWFVYIIAGSWTTNLAVAPGVNPVFASDTVAPKTALFLDKLLCVLL